MASDPDETFVFNVTDFGALQAITDYIVNNTCQISKQLFGFSRPSSCSSIVMMMIMMMLMMIMIILKKIK